MAWLGLWTLKKATWASPDLFSLPPFAPISSSSSLHSLQQKHFNLHLPVAVSKACCPCGILIIMKVKFYLLLRQEHWSGLPFPSPGDLPGPGMEARSPALQADSLPSESTEKPNNNTPVLLPGKSHGQRSLVDCSPWGC